MRVYKIKRGVGSLFVDVDVVIGSYEKMIARLVEIERVEPGSFVVEDGGPVEVVVEAPLVPSVRTRGRPRKPK